MEKRLNTIVTTRLFLHHFLKIFFGPFFLIFLGRFLISLGRFLIFLGRFFLLSSVKVKKKLKAVKYLE